MPRKYDVKYHREVHTNTGGSTANIITFTPDVDLEGHGPMGNSSYWMEVFGVGFGPNSSNQANRRSVAFLISGSTGFLGTPNTEEVWGINKGSISFSRFTTTFYANITTVAGTPAMDWFFEIRLIAHEP